MDYETIELLQAIEQSMPIVKFFSTFFPKTVTHLVEKIQFDMKKGRRRMAPFVAPRVGGKVMTRDGFSTYELRTPKLAPERIITIDDVSYRGIGEGVYSRKTPEERADELLANDILELEEYISNRLEWMCRTIILEGKLDVLIAEEGIDFQIDFNFTNSTTLVGGAAWDQVTSDPIKNLKDWRREVIRKSGKAPQIVLMGEDAYEAFINHSSVIKKLNILNYNLGKIEPKIINAALSFKGEFPEVGQIYTYDEWFIDDDDIEKPFLPKNKVLLLQDEIGSIEYGSVAQQEEGKLKTYEGRMVPKVIVDDDNDSKKIRITSRPLPRPYDVDSWYVADVM